MDVLVEMPAEAAVGLEVDKTVMVLGVDDDVDDVELAVKLEVDEAVMVLRVDDVIGGAEYEGGGGPPGGGGSVTPAEAHSSEAARRAALDRLDTTLFIAYKDTVNLQPCCAAGHTVATHGGKPAK